VIERRHGRHEDADVGGAIEADHLLLVEAIEGQGGAVNKAVGPALETQWRLAASHHGDEDAPRQLLREVVM